MAKRRRRRRSLTFDYPLWIAGIFWLAVIWVAIGRSAPVAVLVGLGALVYFWRKRKRDEEERARREEGAFWEANRRAWRELTFEPGSFSVILSGFRIQGVEDEVAAFLGDIPELRDRAAEEVEALIERVVHVSPQTVADGISQREAVRLKEALELRGAKARIKESAARRAATGREPIPARVRDEVWRRDGGRCVDCGLRERLEYDHIIAVANGGSNTARNIELRCETCNRKKGAKV